MPGIPLLNIGAALGGLSQGYNQSQQQGLQQALARLQLQQAQGQRNAQSLASLALQAGLLGNNNVQTNPLQSLPQPGQSPQVAVSAPQINVPQNPAPQPPAQPSQANAQPADTDIFDYNDAIAAGRAEAADSASTPQTLPVVPGQQPPPGYRLVTGVNPDGSSAAPQTDAQVRDPNWKARWVRNDTASDQTAPALPPSQQTASAGASDTSETSTPSSNQQVGIQLPGGQTIDMSTMFKTVDYGKLAQGIAQLAPPGTSQADIFNAVLDLGKLADGDKVQQQQAGLLARALLGGNFKLAAIGEQQSGAMQRVQAQQEGATGRTQIQQGGALQRTQLQQAGAEQRAQEQIASREKIAAAAQQLRTQGQQIRNANQQRALDLRQRAIEVSLRNANRGDMAAQVTAIRARISTIKPDAAGNYSDQQQAQLKAFNDQIAAIAANASAAGP